MDAVEFMREWTRMCEKHSEEWAGCSEECPMYSAVKSWAENLGIRVSEDWCLSWVRENPETAVTVVEKWAAEHPVVTNAQKFEEVFGRKIDRYSDKLPAVCPPDRHGCSISNTCGKCAAWWDEPYVEPKEAEE